MPSARFIINGSYILTFHTTVQAQTENIFIFCWAPELNCKLNWLCNLPSVGCRRRWCTRNTVCIVLYCIIILVASMNLLNSLNSYRVWWYMNSGMWTFGRHSIGQQMFWQKTIWATRVGQLGNKWSQWYKKLSWCWQTCAMRWEVSQGHQIWYHSIC